MVATITVQVRTNRLPEMARRFRPEVSRVVGRFLFGVDRDSVRHTPVDTGFLVNSRQVRFNQGDTAGEVYWGAGYAAYQNSGTSRGIRPKRFAEQAVDANRPRLNADLAGIEGRL